jgi:hypothetical protein
MTSVNDDRPKGRTRRWLAGVEMMLAPEVCERTGWTDKVLRGAYARGRWTQPIPLDQHGLRGWPVREVCTLCVCLRKNGVDSDHMPACVDEMNHKRERGLDR